MQWRVTGVRRWLPVVLVVSALASVAYRAVRVADPAVGTIGDWVVLALSGALVLVAGVWTVAVLRARVRLTDSGVELRSLRSRRVPYDGVTRAYRDRLASSVVTLLLSDGRTVRLPAPVAGLGVPGDRLDGAVDAIRSRLPEA